MAATAIKYTRLPDPSKLEKPLSGMSLWLSNYTRRVGLRRGQSPPVTKHTCGVPWLTSVMGVWCRRSSHEQDAGKFNMLSKNCITYVDGALMPFVEKQSVFLSMGSAGRQWENALAHPACRTVSNGLQLRQAPCLPCASN